MREDKEKFIEDVSMFVATKPVHFGLGSSYDADVREGQECEKTRRLVLKMFLCLLLR